MKPLHDYAGCGEDDPIYHMRLTRDGWQVLDEGDKKKHKLQSNVWITFDPPILYAKPFSFSEGETYSLRM
ncbi:hypothetical protein ABTH94_21365, partial [Acinetobacter baumannii]